MLKKTGVLGKRKRAEKQKRKRTSLDVLNYGGQHELKADVLRAEWPWGSQEDY